MRKNKKKPDNFVYSFSDEKLNEFKHMPLRARLQWLVEANIFINKAIGFKKRAFFDERFKICASKK